MPDLRCRARPLEHAVVTSMGGCFGGRPRPAGRALATSIGCEMGSHARCNACNRRAMEPARHIPGVYNNGEGSQSPLGDRLAPIARDEAAKPNDHVRSYPSIPGGEQAARALHDTIGSVAKVRFLLFTAQKLISLIGFSVQ